MWDASQQQMMWQHPQLIHVGELGIINRIPSLNMWEDGSLRMMKYDEGCGLTYFSFFCHYFFEMIQFDEHICQMGGETTKSRLPCYDRNQPGSMGLPQGWCRGIPAGTTPGKVIWTNENDDLWSSEFLFFFLFFLKNLSIQVNLFLL